MSSFTSSMQTSNTTEQKYEDRYIKLFYLILICEAMRLNLRIKFCASIKRLGVDLNRCTKQFTTQDFEVVLVVITTHRAACTRSIVRKTDTWNIKISEEFSSWKEKEDRVKHLPSRTLTERVRCLIEATRRSLIKHLWEKHRCLFESSPNRGSRPARKFKMSWIGNYNTIWTLWQNKPREIDELAYHMVSDWFWCQRNRSAHVPAASEPSTKISASWDLQRCQRS